MNGEENKYKPIALNGRWRPAIDGTQLGEGDFQTLTNMRYTDTSIKSVEGMTKINTSVMNATYLKPRAAIHFKKDQPSESHVLVQAWNAGETASQVLQNTTAIPGQGTFSGTALQTDSTGAGYGQFSKWPDGCVAYCNGVDTKVWGGNEYRCAKFYSVGSSLAVAYDYTEVINNTLNDSSNRATLCRDGEKVRIYVGSTRPLSGAKF